MEAGRPPACKDLTQVFFGPEVERRDEQAAREELAKSICFSCEYRLMCLERALVLREKFGVWGGMNEAERKRYARHIRVEGYEKVPEADDFWASLFSFYQQAKPA